MSESYSDERGTYVWRTVGGKRIKIYTGQTLSKAMKESGKFSNNEYKGHLVEEDGNVYYQLNNGNKIGFLDKKEYKEMIDDFYDSLTDEEKEALGIWISDPSYMSNNPLYKNYKDYDKIMDNIFENKAVVLDKDILLFRRASDDYLDLKSGVNRKYAMSTSAYNKIPKTLPSGNKFGEKELYIIAPKGTRFLPIEKVAVNRPYNYEGESRIYARQHEIVLPKKTSYEMVEDLSMYYYRPAKSNEVYDVKMSEQKYVVKLTDKKYNKIDYDKPEYKYDWNYNGYEKYIYNHKGRKIVIKEEYVDNVKDGERWYSWDRREKRPRKDVVKYEVYEVEFAGGPRYFDSYEEAIENIKKYLK